MSITTYLDDFDADLETQRVLSAALEMTRVSLGIADDFANGIIAKRIIELAEVGERDPEFLCEGVGCTLSRTATGAAALGRRQRHGPSGS